MTRRPRRGDEGYVMARRPEGGARTVMPRRAGWRDGGSVITRRLLVPRAGPVVVQRCRHGTQTVLTRRPGRGGRGYVSTRCPRGGARTVMPCCAGRRNGGSLMTRRHGVPGAGPVVVPRWRHGARTVTTRQPRRGGEGVVMTRRHGVRGRATAGGRHDGASDSLPGAARCSRIVLHLPLPNTGSYWRGVEERQRGMGGGLTLHPLSTKWRGGGGDCQRGTGPPMVPPLRRGTEEWGAIEVRTR